MGSVGFAAPAGEAAISIRGGADPIQWIRRYGARISAAHVKDIAPAGENASEDGWADVGHGTIDWAGLQAAIKTQTNTRYWVMEHDNPADDQRFAERSLAATRAERAARPGPEPAVERPPFERRRLPGAGDFGKHVEARAHVLAALHVVGGRCDEGVWPCARALGVHLVERLIALAEARRMLLATDLPVASVAYRCSYQNNAAFTRAFNRRFGVPPTALRRTGAAA